MDRPTAIISGEIFQNHQTGRHVENGARADVLHRLATALIEGDNLTETPFIGLEPQRAAPEQIALVHPRDYLALLQRFCAGGGGQLDLNTVVSSGSFETALFAAGSLLRGVEARQPEARPGQLFVVHLAVRGVCDENLLRAGVLRHRRGHQTLHAAAD